METLEIQVKEEVKVFDSVGEAVAFLERVLQRVWDSTSELDFQIIVRKKNVRAPPALGIKVEERIETKEALS